MGKTLRTGVLAHLDPDKADLLNELAAVTRIQRSVLLREAVDDLLAKHGKGPSAFNEDLRNAFKHARAIVARYRSRNTEMLWIKKCDESLEEIDRALEMLGVHSDD